METTRRGFFGLVAGAAVAAVVPAPVLAEPFPYKGRLYVTEQRAQPAVWSQDGEDALREMARALGRAAAQRADEMAMAVFNNGLR